MKSGVATATPVACTFLGGCHAIKSEFHHCYYPRTADIDLSGRAFLHDYEWRKDEGFGVLELIITAPMVVANLINLQCYGSVVDNQNSVAVIKYSITSW
jgi:hypothetical protein